MRGGSPSLSDHGPTGTAAACVSPSAAASGTGASGAAAPSVTAAPSAIPSTVYSRAAPSNLLADAAQLHSLRTYDRRMRARAVQAAKQIPLAVSTRIGGTAAAAAAVPLTSTAAAAALPAMPESTLPAHASPRGAQHSSASSDRRLTHRSSSLSVSGQSNGAKAAATPPAVFHHDAFDPPLRRQEIVSSRAWLNSASERPVDAATLDDGDRDGDETGATAPSALQGLTLNGRKKFFGPSSSFAEASSASATAAGAQATLNARRLPSQTQDEVERFYASVVPPSVPLSSAAAGAGSHHAHSHSGSSSSQSHHGVLPSLASPRRFAQVHRSASKKRNGGGGGGGGGGRSPSPQGKAAAAAAAKNAQQQQHQRNSSPLRAAAQPGAQPGDARSPGNVHPRPQPLACLNLSALSSSRSPARPSTSEKVAFSIEPLQPQSARSAATSDGWPRSNCTSAATLRASPPRSLAPSPTLLEEEAEEELYTWNPAPPRMEQQPRVGRDGIAVRGVREFKDEFVLLRARAPPPIPFGAGADLGMAPPLPLHPVSGIGPLSPVHSPRHGRGMYGGLAAITGAHGAVSEEKSQLHPANSYSLRLQPQPILSPRHMQAQSQWAQQSDDASFVFDPPSYRNGTSDAAAFSPRRQQQQQQQQQQSWAAHSSPSAVATPDRSAPLAHLSLSIPSPVVAAVRPQLDEDDSEHVYEFHPPAQSLWHQSQLSPVTQTVTATAASPTARMASPSPPAASAGRASLPGSPLLQSLQWESPRSSLAYSRVRDRLPQQQTQP